jgi:hypothetical protein
LFLFRMERIPLDDRLFVAHQEVSFTGNQCAGIAMVYVLKANSLGNR